jgi:hypothetical protein
MILSRKSYKEGRIDVSGNREVTDLVRLELLRDIYPAGRSFRAVSRDVANNLLKGFLCPAWMYHFFNSPFSSIPSRS